MTRKHFEALAAITRTIEDPDVRESVAGQQANYFAEQNSAFNLYRYMNACGVPM